MADDHIKKKLNELRVIDLRSELEKRGLDKNGVKTALIERLTKALQDEGKDPDEYLFEVAAEKTPSKVPVKRSSRKPKGDSEVNNEEEEEEEEKMEEDEDKKEESVKEESQDAEETETQKISSDIEKDEQAQKDVQCNGDEAQDNSKDAVDAQLSPPKPETAPVVAPLTVEDVLKLDSSKVTPCDNESLIVNPDENQSDVDSSINEKDSINEESTQETPDSTTKDTKTVEDTKSITIKEEPVDKKDNVSAKDDSKTNKSAEKTNSTAASETPSATKQKSGGKGTSVKVKEDKDSSGKRSIILISNDSVKRVAASSKNLWVSGLAEKTRANDLKALFSKYGKVSGAKIVTNAKTPGTRCYGFITMASSEEALVCIEKLNRTELHGRIITVEKTTREPSGSIKRADLKSMQTKAPQKKSEKTAENSENKKATEETGEKVEKAESVKSEKSKTEKPKSEKKSPEKPKTDKKAADATHIDEKSKDGTESVKDDGAEHKKEKKRTPSKERDRRDKSRDRKRLRERRSRSRERMGFRGGFVKRGYGRGFGFKPYTPRSNFIDRRRRLSPPPRERDRSREDRRRFSDIIRQREIERKNREESLRLERERERLRIEREKLERERAEVLRLEREKQRLERERLEREKAELRKRTQMTLEDRRGSKRPFDGPRKDLDFWDDRKRGRREPSLDPADSFGDYGRHESVFDRRGDRFEGRGKGGDISPTFNASGRREGRHDHDSFHRGNRNSRDVPERGRDEWKGKGGRDRNFDRPGRNSFNDRGRNFERPHPWEGGPPDREQNKFETPPPMGNSQWAPVNKAPENWGRIDQPPQERWGALEHRGQPGINLGHPPNMGPPNPLVFGGAPGNDIMAPMPGHFPVDRFNSNMMRRF